MPADSLEALQEIHFLLLVLTSAIVFRLFTLVLHFLRQAKVWMIDRRDERARKKLEGEFTLLFEEDRIGELIDSCQQTLNTKPNNTTALWFLLRSHFLREEYNRANDYLLRLKKVDPGLVYSKAKDYVQALEEDLTTYKR
jgi:uncharacterized protein HemY